MSKENENGNLAKPMLGDVYMEKYVIKNRFGEYVNRNEFDGKKLDYFTDIGEIEVAEHYSESEVRMIKERFKGTWHGDGFKVFKIIMILDPVNLT